MKKIKSKLALLFSVALLGTMFIVPSASAETTEQWATLYEQNFKQAGLTKADLTAEGWTGLDKAELSSSGIKGVYPDGGTIKYTADVGSKYKLSGKMYMTYGKNGLVFAFGRSSGNSVTVNLSENKSTALSCGSKSVTFDFKYGAGRQYNYTFLCDGKSVTATLSTEDVSKTKSLTLDEDITPYFEYAHKSYSDIRLQSFKLEVPAITAEFPVSSPFAVERPIEISFNKSVDGETVADALSISPEAGDATVTMSDDGMTAYVKYSNLTPLETYTLSLGTFSNENGVYADEDTYEFSVYELANAVSDNFKAVTTIKNGETFTSWIKLSSHAQNITSVKLCTNENTEGVSATYDSVTGRYVAETSMTETGEIWFEVTDDDDITISVTSDYPVYVQEFSAAPIGFIDSSGNAVTSLSTGAPLTAEFDTDLDDTDSITVMCFYDSEGKMIKLVSANGNTAEIDAVPANAVSVKAMMFKSFASPSMVCGGLELN